MKIVDLNQIYPLSSTKRLAFLKNTIKNPKIIVDDYKYYDDPDSVYNF